VVIACIVACRARRNLITIIDLASASAIVKRCCIEIEDDPTRKVLMSDISIAVTNYSKLSWTRNNWVCGAGDDPTVNWTDQVSQTPSETLVPLDGRTQAAASTEHLGFVVQDALYMTLGYVSSVGDEFAVSVVRRFHVFTVGPGDQWQTYDHGSWSRLTENALPKTWTFANCQVLAKPVLTNETGAVDVMISNIA
jgi:hypothetical protein